MKISGSATLEAPAGRVWDALLDPAVLARTLPGCESLTTLGDDRYAMTITAGVASISGTYTGEVALCDIVAPTSLTLRVSGAGAPGTVEADVRVRLSASGTGGTEVSYAADASVGGAIGGVGQRMLGGVTRKMAGQFFAALDADLTGRVAASRAPEAGPTPIGAAGPGPSAPVTHRGRAAAGTARGLESGAGFAAGVLVGGLLALAGVALGARLGRRR
jgi:uncharacterized protein